MNKLKTCLVTSLSSILLLTGCMKGFFVVTPEDVKETTTQPVVTTRQFVETKPTIYSNFTSIKTSIGALELNLENPVLNKQEVTFDLDVKEIDKFSIDDIEIVVENPDIISVEFKELNATYLYFTVKGKIKGNTSFYLKSKDGAVTSNSIKINVVGEYLMPEDPTPTPKPTPKSKKKKTTKKKVTVTPTPIPKNSLSLDDFATALASANLNKNKNQKWEYLADNTNNGIIIKITQDGAANAVLMAKNGDKEKLEAWNNLIRTTQKLSSTIYIEAKNFYDENHIPSITIMIINDSNTENILLAVKNGMVTYDAVEQ